MSWQDTEPNPFDPSTPDFQPETPTFDQIIQSALLTAAMKMRVHLPGQIVKIHGNQKVDVQPLIQTRYTTTGPSNLPVIQNIMVGMPMGQGYSIKLPMQVGDTGHLIFSDRSLDIWSAGSGGIVDPQDARTHDLSDPVFIPGLVPFSQQTQDTTTDLVITNTKSQLRLLANGGIQLLNLAGALKFAISGSAVQLANGTTIIEADQSTIKIANASTSLGVILTQLLTALTTTATALEGNPSTEPAAAAAGAALSSAVTAVQNLVTELLT